MIVTSGTHITGYAGDFPAHTESTSTRGHFVQHSFVQALEMIQILFFLQNTPKVAKKQNFLKHTNF